MSEGQVSYAIELKDVCIQYRILNSTSIQHSFLRKKKRDVVFEAVKNVSFSVEEGGILGLIGKNGSGKSTLLRSIAGVFSPNAGEIDLHNHSVSMMALGVGFKETLSGRENIMLSGMLLGFSEKDIREKMEEIIDFAELGEFITAMLETDIMLVDEVLSVGDERFRKKSLAKMKSLIKDKNRTVVIVSHDQKTLLELCDRVAWMHEGALKEVGNPCTVLQHYSDFMNQ